MKLRLAFLFALVCASSAQAILWIVPSRFSAPGGGGGTTLDDFSGLVAWYKTPISGATNGAAIPSWPDSKGSHNQTTVTGTSYTASNLNGYATVAFDGSSYVYGASLDSSTYPYTLVAVVKGTNNSDYRSILASSNFGGVHWRINQTTGKHNVDAQSQVGIATGTNAVSTGTWHVLMLVLTSTTWAFYTDGTLDSSGSHSVSLTAGRTFVIGGTTSPSQLWLGDMAEIGVYNQDRSADATSIYNALKTKYGL